MQPLAGWASDLHISLSPEQQEQFEVYLALLLDWNERMNLTAVREPADIQLRHFFDSLTCSLATGDLNDRSLIDVGTGAGFPGIPLKILYPGMRLTLVESIAKKTAFLAAVVAALGLDRRDAATTILTERAETVGRDPEHREQYDWATARSVAELRVLVEYLLPLCRVGGHALAQKGPGAFEEAAAAEKAIAALGGGKPVFHQVELPEIRQARTLVVVEKIAATPERFPRRPGIPAKRPL